MTSHDIVRHAYDAFAGDVSVPPPLTLRGANAVDGYAEASAFDPVIDDPTDAYIEGFAFWGLAYLDAQSWRHYLPRLMGYALRRPGDPAMAIEALVRSLRPPDRYPPRLATLTAEQDAVVVAFLEALALGGDAAPVQESAQQALEEWWLPGARHRPHRDAPPAGASAYAADHVVDRGAYRLTLPAGFASSGPRHIAGELRTVEVWHGMLCGEVPAVVAVNLTARAGRHLGEVLDRAAAGLRAARVTPGRVRVPGAGQARRLDGLTHGDSPAEPERILLVGAVAGREVALLTVRSWPREDVEAAMERIARSFEIVAAGADLDLPGGRGAAPGLG